MSEKIQTTQKDLWTLRAMIQKMGWARFMAHLSGIMAEQADKVPPESKQDKALFNLSVAFQNKGFIEAFQECGFFDYRKGIGMVPEEHRQIILDNPPEE